MKNKYLFLIMSTLLIVNCYGQSTSFGPQQIISTSANNPFSIFATDLTNYNNKIDVVSASFLDNKIAYCQNIGGGTFLPQVIISSNAQNATSVYVKDIDGDGKDDIISFSDEDEKIAWYKNNSGSNNLNFGNEQIVDIQQHYLYDFPHVASNDIDGDNDNDIVTASANGIALYKNDGIGNFDTAVFIDTSGWRFIVLKDIDNDLDIDIIVSNGYRISWFENIDGAGNFGSENIITTNVTNCWGIFVADIDGDNYNDIVSSSDGKIAWYKNNDGLGDFGIQQVVDSSATAAKDVFVEDLDQDGDMDIVAAISNKITWYENIDGNGNFSCSRVVTNDIENGISVFIADIDNDGDNDIISASANDDKIAWYSNLLKPNITSQPHDTLICYGSDAVFSITSNLYDNIIWQVDSGSGFTNLNNNATYTGVNTENLNLTYPTLNLNQNNYRCALINGNDTTFSDTVLLSINYFKEVSTDTICQGDSILWRGNYFFDSDTVSETYLTTNGCDSIYELQLKVNPSYYYIQHDTICQGDSILWQNNYYNSAGTYYNQEQSVCGCDSIYELNLQVNPIPVITPQLDDTICLNTSSNIVLNTPDTNITSLLWNTGDTTFSIVVAPTENTIYSYHVTNSYSCEFYDTLEIVVEKPHTKQICFVTVDPQITKNKVIWEIQDPAVEYVVIRKEIYTNIFDSIGTIYNDTSNFFIDYNSSPLSHGDKYKITTIDTCGNQSDVDSCMYHKTINLLVSASGNTMGLSWDYYEVEDGSFIPDKYYIYKGTTPFNLTVIDSVSGSFNSYNDNNVTSIYYYMVGAKRDNCSNGQKSSYTIFSNKRDNSGLVNIKQNNELDGIRIYPNPFEDIITVEFENIKHDITIIKMYNSIGELVNPIYNIQNNIININCSDLAKGLYYVEIISDSAFIKKIVKK